MRNTGELSPAERRRHHRAPVLLRVDYADASGLEADYVTDIGEGGMFVRTTTPHAVGETLRLVLSFPGLLEATEIECIVRWVAQTRGADGTRQQTGLGLEFAQLLPEHKARLRPLLDVLRSERKQLLSRAAGPFRVLLVEDNRFVCELFKHAVGRFERIADVGVGVRVQVAGNALEALRLLNEGERPHLVIADHYMPGLSGIDFVRRLRADARFTNVPILMASVGGTDVKHEALEAGVTLFLDKPVLLTQLVDTMGALLAQAEACA